MSMNGKIDSTWNALALEINFTLPIATDDFLELVPRNARILELGCGYGRVGSMLADLGYGNLVGYDTSSAMIERGCATDSRLQLHYYATPSVPEPTNSFDAVIGCALLTSIPLALHREAIIAEVHRLLRPGGITHFAEFLMAGSRAYTTDGVFTSSVGIQMKHFTKAELIGELRRFEPLSSNLVEVSSITGEPQNMPCTILAGRP